MKHVALIPSYEPTEKLVKLINELKKEKLDIIVVNDGSDKKYDKYFNQIKNNCTYLKYDTNKGKGYALKTGFKYIKDNYKECGVVTLDSDGQHTVKDTMKLVSMVDDMDKTILLGKRLRGNKTPLRSKLGNSITRLVFRLSTGKDIYDTQTGLRAFKSDLIPFMLGVEGNRFEYEMNMLLDAKDNKIDLKEEVIETIYEDNNSGSHFDTIKDSYLIYKQIFKFMFASFSSFILDYVLYTAFNLLTSNIVYSNIVARIVSSFFNYNVNKQMVFKNKKKVSASIFKYYALAICILIVNTLLLIMLTTIGVDKFVAKLIIEILLFMVSYFVQKRFVF